MNKGGNQDNKKATLHAQHYWVKPAIYWLSLCFINAMCELPHLVYHLQ